MRGLAALALAVALTACGDKDDKADPDATPDATVDAAATKLDRPGTLERPPTGGLPADLRPPR